jgi:hypothetical protein
LVADEAATEFSATFQEQDMTDDLFERGPSGLSDLPSEPDEFGLSPFERARRARMSPFERAAMTQRRAVLGGRDAPDQTTDPATVASVAASFIPGAGLADLLGYMPDFRGGFEPSFRENLRQGDYLSGAAQIAGVFIPGIGHIRKVARSTAGARRLAKRERIFDESIRRPDGEVPQFDLKRKYADVVPDDLARLLATKGLEEKMLARIEEGKKAGGHYWFNTEPLRQVFLKELGLDEGEQAFRKYIKYVAATSAASDVNTNVRNGSHYFGLATREGRLPNVGDRMPHPYGHKQRHNHQIFARKVFDDELDELTYPKLNSMNENLLGNYDPVTIDRHALRLPAMLAKDPNFLKPEYRKLLNKRFTIDELAEMPAAWRNPTKEEYAALEQYYKGLAQKSGLRPAEAQGAAYVGGAGQTNVRDNGLLSFMQHFEDRLHLTADKEKLPAAEVLRRFVRGQMDLVSLDSQQSAIT